MTSRAGEKLIYKGLEYNMASEPLGPYLETRDDVEFVSACTNCWRGYICTWAIEGNQLYLIDLSAQIFGYKEVGLEYLFPGKTKVFANWVTGHIRVPVGELLLYIHMGYMSKFEKDLILNFENGVLIEEIEIDNREEFNKREQELE